MESIIHQSSSEPAFLSAGMNKMQDKASRLQAIPVLGPLVGSPIKAFISTCQLVAALATKIIFGTATLFTDNRFCKKANLAANHHLGAGVFHLLYSAVNVLSLGIVGYQAVKISNSIAKLQNLQQSNQRLRTALDLLQQTLNISSRSVLSNTYNDGSANDSDNEEEVVGVLNHTSSSTRKISPEARVSNESLEDVLLDRREGILRSSYHRSNSRNSLSPVSPLMMDSLEFHEE